MHVSGRALSPKWERSLGQIIWAGPEPAPTARLNASLWGSLDRSFFGPPFDLGGGCGQRYLVAVAHLGDGSYRTAAGVVVAGYDSQRSASTVGDGLIDKELLWSRDED